MRWDRPGKATSGFSRYLTGPGTDINPWLMPAKNIGITNVTSNNCIAVNELVEKSAEVPSCKGTL